MDKISLNFLLADALVTVVRSKIITSRYGNRYSKAVARDSVQATNPIVRTRCSPTFDISHWLTMWFDLLNRISLTCPEGLRVENEALLMAQCDFVRSHLIRIQDGGCISNQYDCSV